MTVNLEKILFNYILKNKNYFNLVMNSFFKNPDIKFIYGIIRNYVINHPEADIPKPRQVFEMIALEDKDQKITKEIFINLIKIDLTEYDEEHFIKKNLESWIIVNRIKEGTSSIIDESRKLDTEPDIKNVYAIADKIKQIADDATISNFIDTDDLGSDFDDAEKHSQDHSITKVKSGWNSLDEITNGGWDRGTLIINMSKTNSGKSCWLQNMSVSAANRGYNVVYFTLEMSEKKVLKRMGSMRLNIPINKYDDLSIDTDYIKSKIADLKNSSEFGTDLFNNKIGKIYVKYFAAGSATLSDFDTYLKKLKERKNIVPDLIMVDYLNLMGTPKGSNLDNNLYMKGKHLAEGLRSVGAKYNAAVLTVTQISKDAWDANDITLQNIPESKAIVETADLILCMITPDNFKMENKFRLKLLKQRDGDFSKSLAEFHINPDFLSYRDDYLI